MKGYGLYDIGYIIETITDSIPQIPPTSRLGHKEPINHQILNDRNSQDIFVRVEEI